MTFLSRIAIAALCLASAQVPARAQTDPAPKGSICRGDDYSGRKHANEMLDGSDFQGAKLTGADFSGASLKKADFRDANLTCAKFDKADMTGADLRGATLMRTSFVDANLRDGNLEGAQLLLGGASMYFKDADKLPTSYAVQSFMLIPMRNGELSFRGANLRNTVIEGNMESVDFRRADLRGSNLSKVENIDRQRLRGAIYDAGTRLPVGVDPEQAAMVRGEEYRVTPVAWFSGLWFFEKEGGTQSIAIEIQDDKSYEWLTDDKTTVKGSWKAVKGTATNPGDAVLLLSEGERKLDWVVVRNPDVKASGDIILLESSDGAHRRSARRKGS